MYGNTNQNEQIILNKKKIIIDDEGPVNKKAHQNKMKKQRKHHKVQVELEEHQQKIAVTKKFALTEDEKRLIMIQDLKAYTDCSQKLISQKLKEANYDKQLALNMIYQLEEESTDMMDLFDKKQEKNPHFNDGKNTQNEKKSSVKSRNKHNKNQYQPNQVQQEAYKIFTQIYEKSEIQISGFEFQQLFNEITQIIKQDQKEKGRGLLEINNLVETCMTAKDTILVGLKDVFKAEAQIEFDQNDPVNIQLQEFIFKDTQKKQQQQVINKEEFPTLGSSNKKKPQGIQNNTQNSQKFNDYDYPSPQKSSIVNKIQNQNRHTNGPITKQDLFKPSNSRPIMFVQKNSIFNVDNQQQSEDALRQLHKEYNHVSINTLKIVYLTLDKNFNQSRLFLQQYYPKEKCAIKKIETIQTVSPAKQMKLQSNRHLLAAFRRESIQQIDSELQRWTLSDLRAEIDHLYGLRQVFSMTCKNIVNSNQRKELMRIADDRAPLSLVQKLSKASRVKLIQETMRIDPHYVDLHGYREEEISTILKGLIASLRQNFDQGNQRIRFRTQGGRTQAILKIMTGKGRHSQYGRSILKPCVKQWCDQHDLRAIVNDDNVEIFIPLV